MNFNEPPFESCMVPAPCVFSRISLCSVAEAAVPKPLAQLVSHFVKSHFHVLLCSQIHAKLLVDVLIFL